MPAFINIWPFFLILFFPFQSKGQSDSSSKPITIRADAFAAASSRNFLFGFSFQKVWYLDKSNRWSVSAGMRSSSLFLERQTLHIRKERDGELKSWNASGFVGNFNIMVQSQLRIWKNYGLGFNLDVAGIGFQQEVDLAYPFACTSCRVAGPEPAKVQRWNLLLGPNGDYGSLNSEFFVWTALSKDIDMRVGWAHYFVQVRYGDRNLFYQAYPNLGFAAISFGF